MMISANPTTRAIETTPARCGSGINMAMTADIELKSAAMFTVLASATSAIVRSNTYLRCQIVNMLLLE
jgi:hypothetical protein